MNVIEPVTITDAMMLSSTVAATAKWSAITTYAEGDEAEGASSHILYTSAVSGNIGNDPESDDGSNWIASGYTNRWRPFDNSLLQETVAASPIEYKLAIPSRVTGIALLGVVGDSITISTYDPGDTTTAAWSTTLQLVDSSAIVDWYSFFTWEAEYQPDYVVEGIPGFAAQVIGIEITAGSGNAQVAEITLGTTRALGETLLDTEIDMEDNSLQVADDFGAITITERPFSKIVNFQCSQTSGMEGDLQRTMAKLRATPCFYYSDVESATERGTYVFGLGSLEGLRPGPGNGSISRFSLEGKGLVRNA